MLGEKISLITDKVNDNCLFIWLHTISDPCFSSSVVQISLSSIPTLTEQEVSPTVGLLPTAAFTAGGLTCFLQLVLLSWSVCLSEQARLMSVCTPLSAVRVTLTDVFLSLFTLCLAWDQNAHPLVAYTMTTSIFGCCKFTSNFVPVLNLRLQWWMIGLNIAVLLFAFLKYHSLLCSIWFFSV